MNLWCNSAKAKNIMLTGNKYAQIQIFTNIHDFEKTFSSVLLLLRILKVNSILLVAMSILSNVLIIIEFIIAAFL